MNSTRKKKVRQDIDAASDAGRCVVQNRTTMN